MKKLNLACVVGARPNFMKMAPLLRAFDEHDNVNTVLVHTGQHYDAKLSDVFFEELEIRKPDISLDVGSGKHGAQTARVLERFEAVLEDGPPAGGSYDRVVVVGDVNSTLATTLAAVKMGIPVAHVEAGLRSFDRTMPEEINRILTDSVADMLLVSEPAGIENLGREGHRPDFMVAASPSTLLFDIQHDNHALASDLLRYIRNQFGIFDSGRTERHFLHAQAYYSVGLLNAFDTTAIRQWHSTLCCQIVYHQIVWFEIVGRGINIEHDKFVYLLLIKYLDCIYRVPHILRVRKLDGFDKALILDQQARYYSGSQHNRYCPLGICVWAGCTYSETCKILK